MEESKKRKLEAILDDISTAITPVLTTPVLTPSPSNESTTRQLHSAGGEIVVCQRIGYL